ncbi:MAG: Clp protease N-terminal domain-containing protein [Pseudorhizobium sp.]
MRTLKYLCERAEAYALQDQQREPGAEHFLLAALDLPDGTARLAVERLGVTPSDLRHAINQQYDDALRSIGLAPPISHSTPMRASSGVYQAAPSAQEIMQELAAKRKSHGPLLGGTCHRSRGRDVSWGGCESISGS